MLTKVSCSAPGKIILCGEHAVVYGKEAIACSLSLRTTCTVEVSDEHDFKISIPDLNVSKSFALGTVHVIKRGHIVDVLCPKAFPNEGKIEEMLLNEDEDDDGSDRMITLALRIILTLYLSIAADEIIKSQKGIHVTLKSQLPIGGGLGSSASFAVAIASSFLVLSGFVGVNQDAWNDKDYNLINDWAFQAEKIVHGTPSGIDNSVSTYGHCLSFKNGKIEQLSELKCLQLDVIVVNTKVTRSTKDLVRGVRERREKFPSLYDSLFHAMECVTSSLKECLSSLNTGDEKLLDDQLKHLVDINQHLLESIGVGHSTISDIVRTCAKYGLASKLTGAGGGGCVVAFVTKTLSGDEYQHLTSELVTHGYECWRTVLGGDGVSLHMFEVDATYCSC